jgi:molecular chaperone IbpA
MTTTTTFDFAPLYRHAVGFDRFANMAQKLIAQQQNDQQRTDQKLIAQRVVDTCNAKKRAVKNANAKRTEASYPRYNISQTGELDYQITLALAGFSLDEIDITVTANELVISGKKLLVEKSTTLLHQGINQANFKRKFALADHVHVVNADMHQGLLTINLNREIPESLQPRKIAIGR